MSFFTSKIQSLLKTKGLTVYALAKNIQLHRQYVYKILNGERRPTDEVLAKLAESESIEASLSELKGWRAVDDYTNEELLEALRAIYPDPAKRKSLLEQVLEE